MLRLLSEVPRYVATAISAMVVLLLAHFIYVLLRDYEIAAIIVGLGLSGAILVIYHRVDFWRVDSLVHLSAWIASAFIPTFIVYGISSSPDVSRRTGSLFTAVGEFRCERLPDQSKTCLNTNSVVRYVFNSHTRNVEVISGEASFVVQKDKRPFDVVSGSLLIRDIGTAFDVYRKQDSTLITVTEGQVKVVAMDRESRRQFELARPLDSWENAQDLHRLQQAEFNDSTGTLRVRPELSDEELSQRLAWQQGRIDLNGLTLAEATEEFSRYQPATRFRYSDLSLRQIRVGGSMDVGSLDDFLMLLEHELHIRHTITQTGDETVITLSRSDRRSYLSRE